MDKRIKRMVSRFSKEKEMNHNMFNLRLNLIKYEQIMAGNFINGIRVKKHEAKSTHKRKEKNQDRIDAPYVVTYTESEKKEEKDHHVVSCHISKIMFNELHDDYDCGRPFLPTA